MKKRFSFILIIVVLCFSAFLSAQNFDWEWQNPLPTGADHNDAIILSPNKFMLFGNGGSFLVSTNQGLSWAVRTLETDNRDIYTATFVDQNIGYVAGTGGLIMKTTDGGDTWVEQNSGTTNVLWDVDFISADTGFVVGAAGIMLYTTNGGTNWTSTTYGTTTLYKVHFVNSTLGFIGSASATTGRLLRTTNGGATWENITANISGLDGTVRGIHFVDENTGWISNTTGRIFKTTNGGATGSQVYYFGSSTNIYEVKFIDANNGYAILTAGRVLKTTDGGSNWTLTQTSATKNLFGLGIPGVQSELTTPVLIGGDAGTIIQSLDDGATWQVIHYAASQEILQRIHFPTENTGFAVGGSITSGNQFGDILKTTDGGITWTKLAFDPGYRVYSVFFMNENVGYIGVQGPTGVYKTTDGGQNWVPLNTNTGVASSIIYDIKFFDENLGFAMYSGGQVARTTDGGSTWSPISAGWGNAAGYEIFVVNSSVIYICGAGGRVSKSTNGGLTFSQLPSLGTATLYGLHFFDENNGFIAASGGRVFKTTNGLNFTEFFLPVNSIMYTIRFVNNNIGWVGGAGFLYYTEDGGDTWVQSDISIGTSQSIRDIRFAGNRMWVAGTDGMIVRGYGDPQIPVELTSFFASVSNGNVLLNWSTATEVNNYGFEVQRAEWSNISGEKDASWSQLGFVTGTGTSSEMTSYTFMDDNVQPGKYFYRLKQVDFNGAYEYSNIIEVDVLPPGEFVLHQNYPNPFNPSTKISYNIPSSSSVKIEIFSITGEKIASIVSGVQEAGYYTVELNSVLLNIASGVYFYRMTAVDNYGKQFTDTKKLLLMK